MITVPEKVATRISEGLKHFQPIVASNKTKDINESDTVVLIIDVLSTILGFDKYNDITTEHAIRGAFCDIALKINGKIQLLVEAKAIGIELKDNHIRQVVDYAANEGVEWVILTNSLTWKVFKVVFSKPIQSILVGEINILELKNRNREDIEKVYILTKEAIGKSSLDLFFNQKQATNRFMIGNLIYSEPIIHILRRELHRIFPDIKVQLGEIKQVLLNEVLKREILEGEDSALAQKKISKLYKRKEKLQSNGDTSKSETINDSKESIE